MRIAIITVYQPNTNLGSYLQCFALKTYLEDLGHQVNVIGKIHLGQQILNYGLKIRPIRAFFLRIQKILYSIIDISKLDVVYQDEWDSDSYDLVIFGSDEIWNLHNQYFATDLFWGIGVKTTKVAYAISVGHMTEKEFDLFPHYKKAVADFFKVLPRDFRTKNMLLGLCDVNEHLVCDPTLLINVDRLSLPICSIKHKYILVYSYGLSTIHIEYVKKFAKENNLIILSPCFWHIWADKVVECSALQFSSLIRDAHYVFTTTFHGAIFTMLNHKKCCIYSQREKVGALVDSLGLREHLLSESASYEDFVNVMNLDFPKEVFTNKLEKLRDYSRKEIEAILSQVK